MQVSATLNTVSDCLGVIRTLLQDFVEPYRYPNADVVAGLNFGLLDMKRVRPDLFIGIRYENQSRFIVAGDKTGGDPTQVAVFGPTIPAMTPIQKQQPRRHGVLTIPSFDATSSMSWTTALIPIPPEYRMALVYYAAGHVQLRDDEVTQDSRAAAFIASYRQSMGV